ncbi:hypothetical protein [Streptomyces yangpuensis]|uniref:hypothetical protein n=1 Tax=Streptomyces yangpuensis TaxID=1648182 RepID=UPI00365D3C89
MQNPEEGVDRVRELGDPDGQRRTALHGFGDGEACFHTRFLGSGETKAFELVGVEFGAPQIHGESARLAGPGSAADPAPSRALACSPFHGDPFVNRRGDLLAPAQSSPFSAREW